MGTRHLVSEGLDGQLQLDIRGSPLPDVQLGTGNTNVRFTPAVHCTTSRPVEKPRNTAVQDTSFLLGSPATQFQISPTWSPSPCTRMYVDIGMPVHACMPVYIPHVHISSTACRDDNVALPNCNLCMGVGGVERLKANPICM